ncbi:MAG: 2OG-Fe(II) oxygenase [Aestuariivirga sp.]
MSVTTLATRDDVLAADLFAQIAAEVEALVETERSYLPTHKKGGTVAYSALRKKAPTLVDHYLSVEMRWLVSRIVGVEVRPTPLHDESSCSVLFYEKPGDHINWHYDHNFYRGRHFTVLIPLVNRGRNGVLSAARLQAKHGGQEVEISTPPNRMIVFEGAKVRHKVTPISEGERRCVWSMTYCVDPRNSAFQGVARRVKDTAFFGLRSLWT